MEHSCAIKGSFRSLRISGSFRLSVVAALLVVPALRSFRLPVVPAFRSFHLYCFSSIAYCPNNRLLIVRYWPKTETHLLKDDDKIIKQISLYRRCPTPTFPKYSTHLISHCTLPLQAKARQIFPDCGTTKLQQLWTALGKTKRLLRQKEVYS